MKLLKCPEAVQLIIKPIKYDTQVQNKCHGSVRTYEPVGTWYMYFYLEHWHIIEEYYENHVNQMWINL